MSSTDILPLNLRLLGKDVLLVGAGPVAARRLRAFLDAGARITVVAPQAVQQIQDLADAGLITWHKRVFEAADLGQSWIVQVATGQPTVDAHIAALADAQRIWCLNASDQETASAWMPAVARSEDVVIAVSAGGDPRRAMAIRDALHTQVQTGGAPLRKQRASATPGKVALVGGGPGEAGLITVRGRMLLAAADVIVADRLGPRSILTELTSHADGGPLVIEVGKAPGLHLKTQDEINQTLVEQATPGKLVVRLKGGDPYVLGRGGEEALYCREHGIDVEVVPGVTSAISVPAAAGIPVTHRGVATGFSVATGHAELEQLPARSDHTLVILMGVATLNRSVELLLSRGLPAHTPVAIVESGWTKDQRVTTGTLVGIGQRAKDRNVQNPAVIVIGDVARLSPYWDSAKAEATARVPHLIG